MGTRKKLYADTDVVRAKELLAMPYHTILALLPAVHVAPPEDSLAQKDHTHEARDDSMHPRGYRDPRG